MAEAQDGKKDKKDNDNEQSSSCIDFCFAAGLADSSSPIGVPDALPTRKVERVAVPAVKSEPRSPAKLETPARPRAPGSNTPARPRIAGSNLPTNANQAGKGRKKHDWEAAVAADLKSFADSSQADALWWGSGAQTKKKDLEKKRDQVSNRIRNCNDMSEVEDLHKWKKAFSILIELVAASANHGLLSHDFKVMLDTQDSFRKLEPVVEIEWPKWMVWERHTQDIGSEVDAEKWHGLVATEALVAKGVLQGEKLVEEQTRLWNEKFAEILRKDCNEVLKRYFPQDISAEDVQESTFLFVSAFAVVLRATEFDLEDRIELLQDAFEILDDAIPCPARRHPGTPLGVTLSAFKRGTCVVSSARLALAAAKLAKSSLDAFAAKLEEFKKITSAVKAKGGLTCSEHEHQTLRRHAEDVVEVQISKITPLDQEFQSDAVDLFLKVGGEDFVSLVSATCLILLTPLGGPELAGLEGVKSWHRHFDFKRNEHTESKDARITEAEQTITHSVHRGARLRSAVEPWRDFRLLSGGRSHQPVAACR